MTKFKILGVELTSKPRNVLLKDISFRLNASKKTIIFTPNPEILVKAHKDKYFKNILNSSDINIVDGYGVKLLAKLVHKIDLVRIPGRLLFVDLLEMAEKEELKVFFLGSTDDVNKRAIEKARAKYPKANFKGASVPLLNNKLHLVSESNTNEYNEIIKYINEYSPDILFVALGAPKQEKWIIENRNLPFRVSVAIGGCLNYFSNKSVLPPNLFSRLGLEWIWRGIFEPWRIKRIFNAVIIFPYLVLKEKFI